VLPATKICVLKFSFFNISAHAPRGGGGGGGAVMFHLFWMICFLLFLGAWVKLFFCLVFFFFDFPAGAGGGGGGGGGGCIVRSYCVNCLLAFMQASATTFSYVRVSFWLGSARF